MRDNRDEWLRQAMGFQDPNGLISFINEAIGQGRIISPDYQESRPILAGGTNFCPNSDFAWSHMAATLSGILPTTAGDTNYEVYRLYRQVQGANISATRVRSTGHSAFAATEGVSPWIPAWDRVQGNISLGWDGTGGGGNWDVAIEFTNTWLQNNRYRYIRVALATESDTPLPTGVKLYAGYWAKYSTGSEGWVDGNGFTVTYRRRALAGTRHLQYFVIAKTASGTSLGSAVLDVLDAPATLDADNYIEITYTDATGFVEFLVYRKDVSSGRVDLISRDVNSDQLWAYDVGQSVRVETGGFPTAGLSSHRAYAEVLIDALPYAQQMTFHDMRVRIPATFDTSQVVAIYLRIGVLGATATSGQLILDTVWESDSFNVWAPSPFDDYPSPRSTTLATAPPSGGGSPVDNPPVGGGGSCLWSGHDILTGSGWWSLNDLPLDGRGVQLPLGNGEVNILRSVKIAEVSQWFTLKFDNGLTIMATGSHRFGRSMDDGSGVQVAALKEGDSVLGGNAHGDREVTLLSKVPCYSTNYLLEVRTVKNTANSFNKLYKSGNRRTGAYVYSHNNKPVDI